ncbi:DDE superfamily endonuclease [Popillia japonica]|uniref:DDE superfamily endonuclease n=1 Tax=Popillia japonica TaxID=7064 RepID=A0AAW1KIQ8_POPJA
MYYQKKSKEKDKHTINKVLRQQYIYFPNDSEAKEIACRIKNKTAVEQVFGFIDGTHIPILPPKDGYRDFINRKGWASLILQAVVDDNYLFRDITISFPGSCHDALVFKESNLYKASEEIIPIFFKNIDGLDVPLMLIGDPAYPLLPWLLKGYTGPLLAEEESFNCYLSSARICVENAFGSLCMLHST